MKILLDKLVLKNFKGIKDFEVVLGNNTDIFGRNASGKTSIVDAFTWLMFGKDSKGNSNFNIKTIDANGEEMHGLEHSVEGVLNVDGKRVTLKKTYKEVWQKQRGQAEKTFKGHAVDYEINDVPAKQKEYKEKVDSILNEEVFKLVTNPTYFPSLHWQKQREIVLSIIGDIEADRVINYNSNLKQLDGLLEDGIDTFMKETKAKITKLKDKIKSIPFRIDECNNSMVDADFKKLEEQRQRLVSEVEKLDEQIEDSSKKNQAVINKQNDLLRLKTEYQNQKNEAKGQALNPKYKLEKEIAEVSHKAMQEGFELESLNKQLLRAEMEKKQTEINKEKHIKEWNEVCEKQKNFVFDKNNAICPTCRRELDPAVIESKKAEMQERFNSNIAKEKADINAKGKSCNKMIADKEQLIEELKIKISALEEVIKNQDIYLESKREELANFTPKEVEFLGEQELLKDIDSLQQEIESMSKVDNQYIKDQKRVIQADLVQVDKLLAGKDNNSKMQDRIKELENEEKEASIIIAQLEGKQFLGEEFIKTKVELLEGSINNKFKEVRFKLFNNQINGGLEETCEITVDGVPYKDLNSAGKINSGIEVIDVLCEHYDITAPIFIDNAESINDITRTNSQQIKLHVSNDEILRVEV